MPPRTRRGLDEGRYFVHKADVVANEGGSALDHRLTAKTPADCPGLARGASRRVSLTIASQKLGLVEQRQREVVRRPECTCCCHCMVELRGCRDIATCREQLGAEPPAVNQLDAREMADGMGIEPIHELPDVVGIAERKGGLDADRPGPADCLE